MYVTTNLVVVSSAILWVIVLPKITQFLGWVFWCSKLRYIRRHSGLIMGIINAFFLLVFEGLVVKNLTDLVSYQT
ncbi:hypothetical protein OESDEN_02944 [Oesophagostomum dentatum]|uniref:Uncharacterized protein n=1 Tax=Oesophagostomum dentatum TaxID=61180 RepID=A0A0B1TMN6_OESDE|nr:hypothetical protein OESDEN_02944 [Oesophagostomum dentatum]